MENQKYQYISLERKGKICILNLNRPEKKNALSLEMRTEIINALDLLENEKRVKCVIIY